MKGALWVWPVVLFASGGCNAPGLRLDKPTGHELREIQGWIVAVDHRLSAPETDQDSQLGAQALALLEDELKLISRKLPEEYANKLRSIPIWLDKSHGAFQGEMYHPDRQWLVDHHYDPSLWRGVQVSRAAQFCDPARRRVEPLPLLHQLIHGFQDRAFGFEGPRIVAGYERFKARHAKTRVLLPSGERGPHPALIRPREYFLEMSLAYFNLGRVPPKTAEALKQSDLETFQLIEACWRKGSTE